MQGMNALPMLSGLNDPTPMGGRQRSFLPPELEESGLAALARQSGSFVESLGLALDTPGAIARGVLAGDPMSGFSWDSDRRVTGEELLNSYGILDESDNPYYKTFAGLAAEIATDPLSWLTGPMGAVSKAGKAAKAANILDLAPIAAQNRMGYSAAAKTLAGRYTDDALEKLLPNQMAKNAGNLQARPLVGPRLARSTTTLDEVVQAAPDPAAALKKVTQYLDQNGLTYDAVKDDKLGGLMGFGFMDTSSVWNPEFAQRAGGVLDAMDSLGQRVAWSAPARYASAWFDNRLADQTKVGDQIAALRRNSLEEAAKEAGRRKAVRHVMTVSEIPVSKQAARLLGADTLFSPQGNDFLTRLFEGAGTQADQQLASMLPGIDNAYQSWDDLRKESINVAKQLGLQRNEYKDRFGILYSPRSGTEFDFEEWSKGLGNSLFNTGTAEKYSRQPNLITPGGTSDLREVSLLKEVREHAMAGDKSQYTNEEVGKIIADYINNKHGPNSIDETQGTGIARVMMRLNKDLPDGIPAFAEHPLNAQARNIINGEMAAANAQFVYESIAESSLDASANQLAGGRYKPLDIALNDIARTVGLATTKDKGIATSTVRKNVIDRIAQRTGIDPKSIDLSKFAIPEDVHTRLTKVHEFYSSPKAQSDVMEMFEKFTTMFKGFVLAWPSRHVRDMYSNLFSVWLETGNGPQALAGFGLAKTILRGEFDSVADRIRMLPQYSNIADNAALKRQFMEDAGGTGILSTLATSDLLTASRSGEISQLVPGSTPISRGDALKQLVPDGTRSPAQMLQDFGAIRGVFNKFETRNPLLNASQKLSDVNDSVARLGGYIALLGQGVSPEQAANRMRAALVDYSSLTPIERNVMRNIFPWWAYSSRIGKYVVEQLIERPGGRYGQTLRALNTLQRPDEGHYIPTALRSQFAVRLPLEDMLPEGWRQYVGGTGTDTYFKDLDVPGVDVLNILKPGSLQGTAAELFNQAHPLMRSAAEVVTNQDFFSKRPLDEAVTPLDRLYQRAFNTQTRLNPIAKSVIQNIPGLQRPISFFGGLVDDRLPLPQRLVKQGINTLSGVKLQDVDPEWQLMDARKKIADDLKGYSSTFTESYIPEDLLPEVPQDKLLQYMLDKELRRDLREYKDRKRKQREFEKQQ